ncbi:hypothetical protein GGI23_003952, partial [Coemansia sp. RSA 2559]
RYACDSVFDYEYGIDVDGSASDAVSAVDPVPVFPKRMEPGAHAAYPPQRLSIYTFREDVAEHRAPSIMPRLPSKRSIGGSIGGSISRSIGGSSIHGAVELSSMEDEGSWMAAVEKCRSTRSQPEAGKLSRLYVYPLAYIAVWLPALVYCVMSTYVYHRAFEANGGFFSSPLHAKRAVHLADLPAHWTQPHNMHRAWPYYAAATHGVSGSSRLSWLAVLQALHLLGGFVNAVLFWLTDPGVLANNAAMRRRCSHEPHISPCYNFCTAHSHNTWCRKELMQMRTRAAAINSFKEHEPPNTRA